jgi:hypothetical protein
MSGQVTRTYHQVIQPFSSAAAGSTVIKLANNRHYKRDAHGYSERYALGILGYGSSETVASEIFGIVSEKGESEGGKIVLLILTSVVQRQLHLS